MSEAPILRRYSYAEYSEIVRATDVRHEYVEGIVRAMAGGSGRHNAVTGRLFIAVHAAALAAGCQAYVADRRLDIGGSADNPSRSYYPDVMVVCSPDLDTPGDRNPCFVAEVLSESTAAIDQLEKLTAYTNIASLLVYALVHQHERRVTLHRRSGDTFHAESYTAGMTFSLDCPEATVAVDDLYAGL